MKLERKDKVLNNEGYGVKNGIVRINVCCQ